MTVKPPKPAPASSSSNNKVLPLLPLAHPAVLLPGTTLRVPIAGRPDIAALLANIYARRTAGTATSNILLACVPLASPGLSRDGKLLIEAGGVAKDGSADGEDEEDGSGFVDPGAATEKDIFGYGCLAKVSGVRGRGEADLALVVEGVGRCVVERVVQERPYFEGELRGVADEDVDTEDVEFQTSFDNLKRLSRELLALIRLASILPRTAGVMPTINPLLARRLDIFISSKKIDEAGQLADYMAHILALDHAYKLRILAASSVKHRLELVTEALQEQIKSIQGHGRIMTITTTSDSDHTIDSDRLRKLRQEALLRRGGLGGGFPGMPMPPGFGGGQGGNEDEANEIAELKKRLEEAGLKGEAKKVATRELQRLGKMNPAQAEYQVCRNYLENLAEIPWSKVTVDGLGKDMLAKARAQLDRDHYGLEPIKKRLLEYLAVLRLKRGVNETIEEQLKKLEEADEGKKKAVARKNKDLKVVREPSEEELALLEKKRLVDKSPILLLVGPPGTGKTSLAKSIATALGRKFHRISLGGVRDEAEIRGHRRTYVAAMPGLIVNGLKKVGVANPVFLLDEIDKVGGSNFHGDPSAAMLEVLDPEQNHTFTDHYVNIPIDLSKVLFIATANSLDTIPPPLLDRMETIHLSGYTTLEKRHIAQRHLLPKQILTNGLTPDLISIAPEVLDKIITSYTRESGVRNLERELGHICRFKAVEYAEAKDHDQLSSYNPVVGLADLENILGIERFEEELAATTARPGVVTGLVAYSSGGQGSILFIEVADMPGNGRVQLTGTLGEVLKESVEVALSWVKAHAFALALTHDPTEDLMKSRSVHVHCPAGAVPKDGPSAGLAHTIALISLFAAKPVPPTLAMTGEVSLRGRVLPVGGIKEKLIGALRAGVKVVLLPEGNRKDVRDVPEEVKRGLEVVHVGSVWEALRWVWPEEERWREAARGREVESRL